MGQVQALVLSDYDVPDGQLHHLLGGRTYQPVDAERVLKMVLGMFKSRAYAPVQFVLLYQNHIGFKYGSNVSHMLEYAGPCGEWASVSEWYYVIARDFSGAGDEDFALIADLVRALCNTFPEIRSPELVVA